MDLYITFGLKYGAEAHPTWSPAHPDGYLRVIGADSHDDARDAAVRLLGSAWAFDYTAPPPRRYAPRGELGVLDARTDVVVTTTAAGAARRTPEQV